MNARSILIMSLAVLSAAALWGVVAQGRQLSDLRAEKNRLDATSQAPNAPITQSVANSKATPEVPRELLQLRAEVARLSQQQRELSGARAENNRLRVQLENRRTNSAAANQAQSGYILPSRAKWVGYNTPEDTFQSLFWAIKNHNLEKFQEAVAAEAAEEFNKQINESTNPTTAAEEFFKSENFPPVKIIGREQISDDTIALRIQLAIPDAGPEPRAAVDSSESIQFKRIGGQWKLSKTH